MKKQEGQTVIETALIMLLILMLFFGIAEIARAWWLKGQLNTAARVGGRVAVVQSSLAGDTCRWSGGCVPQSAALGTLADAACKTITNKDLCAGVFGGPPAVVNVSLVPANPPGTGTLASPKAGDQITVQVTGQIHAMVPGLSNVYSSIWGRSLVTTQAGNIPLNGQAVMRHE